jgi:hypothetical protein
VYNQRIGFVHLPKTGGTWIKHALRSVIPDLVEPDERKGHLRWDEVPSKFVFGFVRDPATWYESYWSHRKTYSDWDEHPIDELIRETEDFASFVHAAYERWPGFLSDYYEVWLGPPGTIYVGRYERLMEDLLEALVLSGELPPDFEASDYGSILAMPPINMRFRNVEITPELREMIYASEAQAVERYGYSADASGLDDEALDRLRLSNPTRDLWRKMQADAAQARYRPPVRAKPV